MGLGTGGAAVQPLALLLGLTLTGTALPLAAQPLAEASGTLPVQTLPQDEAATPREAARSPAVLESVTVTAQKREQNAQDVPISVAAFNARALDQLAISDQSGLQQAVPGLDVNEIAQFTTIFLRGVGSDAFLMADPSVASYVDGIYFPFAQGLDQDFGTVDRVEVLKGPQGTLFGRNAVGGAISVYTRNPDYTQSETSVQAVRSNRDNLGLRIYQNIPLTSWLALNLSAYYHHGDHYMRGTANGEPLDAEVGRGARVKLGIKPFESLEILLAGLRLDQQGTGSVFQLNSDPSALFRAGCTAVTPLPTCIRAQTGYQGALSEPSFLRFNSTVGYGQATWKAPWFDFRLLGSDQHALSKFTYDFDGSDSAIAAFDQKRNFANVQSAEVQLLSNDGSWGSSHFQWILGGYWFKSAQGFDPASLQLAGLDLANAEAGGISLPQPLIDALNELGIAFPNGDVAFHAIIGTESRAGFLQATLKFTDWLSLTLGGRYQTEDREIIKSDSGLFQSGGGFQTLFDWKQIGARDGDGNDYPIKDTTTSFRPKASLELRPIPNLLIYGSYQEAEKSGTYNTVALYQRPAYVKPEELKAYEVGLKSQWFNDAVQFNLAAFDYDIRNLQVQFISLFQGGAVSFENADAARVRGIDFDSRFRILPRRLDRFVLSLSGAWLDGEYTAYPNGSGFDPQTGFFSGGNDYSGNRSVRTPHFTGVAGLSKSWDVPGGRLELGGDIYRNSGFFYSASNDPRFDQPRYTLYGARASYLYRPWGLRLSAYGRNLGNTQYSQGLIATDFGPNYTLAPPISYGVRLNWDF